MCVFCAAIPATAAVGANLNAKQKTARQAAEKEGLEPRKEKPIARATLVAIILLTGCSAIYHFVLSPILRI
jgi:hypothetical protein